MRRAALRNDWLPWTPRILSLLLAGFVSLFSLDVFAEQRPWTEILPALVIHLLPTCALLVLLLLAWRRPWIGAAGYAALALAYSAMAWRHPDWVALIGGPLLLIAFLFWLSWRRSRQAPPPAGQGSCGPRPESCRGIRTPST